MKIAAHVLAYNVNRFIRSALCNMGPYVEKIYVAYPSRPWGYLPESRRDRTNPTSVELIYSANLGDKVEIIQGDWLDEESMRNSCLKRAREDGHEWLVIQDADEFYPEDSWGRLRERLESGVTEDLVVTTWYNFWKSSQYVLVNESGSIKDRNVGFAIRCRDNIAFQSKRQTNAKSYRVIDEPCYHYGYVMSDDEMHDKVTSWGHAREFNAERWYQLKWRHWRVASRYLHPTQPTMWRRAARFPMRQPEFAEQFVLPIGQCPRRGLSDVFYEGVYDLDALLMHKMRKVKSAVKGRWISGL